MPRRAQTVRQIALYFIAFYTAASSLLAVGAYLLGEHALGQQLDNRIAAEGSLLRKIHDEGGLEELIAALTRRENRGVNNLGYLLTGPDGATLGGELDIAQLRPGWHDIALPDPEEPNDARALTIALPEGATLTIAAETEASNDLQDMFLILFLPGFAVMLIGGLAGGLLLGRAIRNRITVMNDTALAISAGQTEQRIPVNRQGDEFAQLATTLNHMLDRNSRLIANLRQVSSDIAHDLRTPIAHLRQRLERAARMTTADQRIQGEIEGAIGQADMILSLFSALLRISEVESGALHRYFRQIDLSATARRVCEAYALAAEDSGHALRFDLEDGLQLIGDDELIAQALVNLLENCLRHTPAGTAIDVRLSRGSGVIRLEVVDDGPGVPDADLPQLTQRFTRLDRARAAPGYGLGLNLVSAIVTAHGGQLRLSSTRPGFQVQLEFPNRPRPVR